MPRKHHLRPRPRIFRLVLALLLVPGFTCGCSSRTSNAPPGGEHGTTAAQAPLPDQDAASVGLNELNRLREIGGLKPVTFDASLNTDCYAHAKYLVDQGPQDPQEFAEYRVRLGLGAHTEDPHSKYYSAAGIECTQGGEPTPGYSRSNDVAWGHDPKDDLDGLFYDAPFHRLSLLAAWATAAGYGSYGTWPMRVGVLSLRGEGGIGSPLIRFPTADSTVPVGEVRTFEVPNPLSSCAGYELPVGLPITIQFGSGYRGHLMSYSLHGPGGPVETCGFDWTSYRNSNATEQAHGRKSLQMFGAMVLVPREPLANGRYDITVNTGRQTLAWSFTVEAGSSNQGQSVSKIGPQE